MEKQKGSFLKKLFFNKYIKHLITMVIIALALIYTTLLVIKKYTRHDEMIEVPELKGLQVEDASAIVTSRNIKYEIVDSVFNKNATPGAILEQIPKGKSMVKQGRTIYLTIQAKNEPLVSIPDLVDASLRQAETLLNALGITQINIVYVPSEFQDLVYGVEYRGTTLSAGDKIPKGSVVVLKVGNGNSSPVDSLQNDGVENNL